MSTKHPAYTREFKQQVVEDVLKTRKPKTHIARKYGVSIGSVKNWVKQYQESHEPPHSAHSDEAMGTTLGSIEAPLGSQDKSAREQALEREVQQLREELAFIRKVAAYIAQGPA